MTLDKAQDQFRSNPTTRGAEVYAKTAREYRDDDMIGEDTLLAALREVDAYYIKRDNQ